MAAHCRTALQSLPAVVSHDHYIDAITMQKLERWIMSEPALWKDVMLSSPPIHRLVASGGAPKASVAHSSSLMSSISCGNSSAMLHGHTSCTRS